MYDNVFVGENAHKQPKRILILGESHYKEDGEFDGTASVVKYLAINGNDTKTQFYKNIMRTFGYEITGEGRKEFWNKVYCGNYVADLCGKGKNNTAAQKISYEDEKTKIKNRVKYNDSLFKFINENEIDIVFCFSRLVYNNLPSFAKDENQKQLTGKHKLLEHPKHELYKFEYKPNCEHKNCTVKLKKPLTVYGFKHPSACYSHSTYYDYFKDKKECIGL